MADARVQGMLAGIREALPIPQECDIDRFYSGDRLLASLESGLR